MKHFSRWLCTNLAVCMIASAFSAVPVAAAEGETETVTPVSVDFEAEGLNTFADLTTKYGFGTTGAVKEIVDAPNSTKRGKALKIKHDGTGGDFDLVYIPFGDGATTGSYTISYDMYEQEATAEDNPTYYTYQEMYVDLSVDPEVWYSGGQNLFANDRGIHSLTATTSGMREGDQRTTVGTAGGYAYGQWRTIEHVVNMDAGTVKTTIKKDDGTLYGQATANFMTSTWDGGARLTAITGLSFAVSYGETAYIDNIKMAKMAETKPEIKADKISYTYSDGSIGSGQTNVRADISSITLDFGTAMKASTLTDGITLKEGGVSIPCTIATGTTTVTLTLPEGALSEGTSYTLAVADTVKTAKDESIQGTPFTYTFTTAKSETKEEIDFDDVTDFTDLSTKHNFGGVIDAKASCTIAKAPASAAGIDRKNALKLELTGGNALVYQKFDSPIGSGRYKFSYDLYEVDNSADTELGWAQTFFTELPVSAAGYAGDLNLFAHQRSLSEKSGTVSGTVGTLESRTVIGDFTYGSWKRIEHVVDLNQRNVTTTAYEENGDMLGMATATFKDFDETGSDLTAFQGIRFRAWFYAIAYIDNLKIEELESQGTIDKHKVSFVYSDGTTGGGLLDIRPDVSSIQLDFGTKISYTSAVSGIQLIYLDADGNRQTVSHDTVIDGNTVKLNLDGILKADTAYSIAVSGSVKDSKGNTVTPYVHNFRTAKGECAAEVKQLLVNGAELGSFASAVAGTQITAAVSYRNSKTQSDTATALILAYDQNHVLRDCAIETLTLSAETAGTATTSALTLTQEAYRIEAFLVDSIDNMQALGAAKTLGTGIETTETSDEAYAKVYDYTNHTVSVVGKAKADTKVSVMVLQPGKTFAEFKTMTDAQKKTAILYSGTATAAKNGQWGLSFAYNPQNDTDAAAMQIYGIDEKPIQTTVELLDYTAYQTAVNAVNQAANNESVSDADFAQMVQDKANVLGTTIAPLTALTQENVAAYRSYLKSAPLNTQNREADAKTLKSYMVLEAVKANLASLDNLDAYMDEMDFGTATDVYQNYVTVARNEKLTASRQLEAQKHFTACVKSAAGSTATMNDMIRAMKEAIVLTAASKGSGYATLKTALGKYGSLFTLNGAVTDQTCQKMTANQVVYNTKTQFEQAWSVASQNNGGGNSSSIGGGGGGGLSSSNALGGGGSYGFEPKDESTQAVPLRKNFNDIDNVEWAQEAILALADQGIVDGEADGVFNPSGEVTREQFVKLLIAAMGYGAEPYTNHFKDVSENDWFCPWVNIAYEKGICLGIGDQIFGVGQAVTRQDMVVLLYNALNHCGAEFEGAKIDFDDAAQIADYAKEAVEKLTAIGAVNGVSETEFAPLETADRAQAATVIYRVLTKLQKH